jgi:hypothetical protein
MSMIPQHDAYQNFLSQRLSLWSKGQLELPKSKIATRTVDGVVLRPSMKGFGQRSNTINVVKERERILSQSFLATKDGIKTLETIGSSLVERTDDANKTYRRINGIVQPEYNLLEPFTIYDTEPYVRQATNRKLSLMFRNGFEVSGDKDEDIEYIQRRFEAMEYVMERTTESFFKQILFNLLLCSNCFLQKIRNAKATIVKKKEGRPEPVAGYRLIPAHMIFPFLKDGVPVKWRRFFDTGAPFEDIDLEDIIHLKWDVKPGHRFGTPRLVGVRDDIFTLRRLEENVELLFINFLFPLYHIKVGSEDNPASYDENGHSEIDLVKWQIENMPKEGVFVTDERTEVKIVGAEGKSLKTDPLIQHYKSRIFTGMGMSALDMGDASGATRSTADNISQNLKDAIKSDLENFGGMIRMSIFKEFFMEATYSVGVQGAVARTLIKFHEIDLDNKIKEENHVIQLFLNNLIDEDEARKRIGYQRFQSLQVSKLHFDLHVVRLVKETEKAKVAGQIALLEAQGEQQKELMPLQAEHAEKQSKTQQKLLTTQTAAHEKKAAASVSVLKAKTEHLKAGGRPQTATAKKSSPGAKTAQNKETPTNQHGANLGPTKAKSSLEHIAAEFTDALTLLMESLKDENGTVDHDQWSTRSAEVIDEVDARLTQEDTVFTESDEVSIELDGNSDTANGNSYTRQARAGLDYLKDLVTTTEDPELISVLVSFALSPKVEDARADTSYDLPSAIPGANNASLIAA